MGGFCGTLRERRLSRLDSFIRRLEAQRRCLDLAVALVADLPGPVLELGLGNGRTYDHLRERLPERPIWVFERDPRPHPECRPAEARLIVGDLADTLPGAKARIGAAAALLHADLGSADPTRDRALARLVADHLPALVASGGVVVADQDMAAPGFAPVPVPEVAPGRYFVLRRVR